MECSICGAAAEFWRAFDGFDFSDCEECGCIAIERGAIVQLDEGTFPRHYDPSYWEMETSAARQRSFGASLARVAETVLYCRRPIEKFVDIGTGPGFLIDALSKYLPSSKSAFHAVEMFPPKKHSKHPNYFIGHISQAPHKFDAGTCIEVVEHLTPTMLDGLAKGMAERSNPEAVYLINTALSHLVRERIPDYIDPLRRGHVISWSLRAIETIFGPYGFKVWPLEGKDWAFLLEFESACDIPPIHRIWTPPPENLELLKDPVMGELIYCVGIDTARAYR